MCSAKSFQLFAKIATCPPRGSISKIATMLCVITVRQHSSIAILLMDPRGIWHMKPNVFCKVFSTFHKCSTPVRVHQQNSNAAVCDHCQATQQHCYFADGPLWDFEGSCPLLLKTQWRWTQLLGGVCGAPEYPRVTNKVFPRSQPRWSIIF